MADVWDSALEGQTAAQVMLVLANEADDVTGMNCFPGTRRIARRARVSERTVIRTIHELEAEGWLKTLRRGSGAGNRTEYRLNLRRLHEQAEATRTREREERERRSRLKGCHHDTFLQDVESAAPTPRKGDIDAQKGDTGAQKGDIDAMPLFVLPVNDPLEEKTHTAVALPREGVRVLEAHAALDRAADQFCSVFDIESRRTWHMVRRAIAKRAEKGDEPRDIAQGMIFAVKKKNGHREVLRPCGLERFLGDGMWADESRWPWDRDAEKAMRLLAGARVGSR